MIPLPASLGGTGALAGWTLHDARYAVTWNSGIGSATYGGRWNSIGKHVMDGKGTKEEIHKLLEYYPSLLLNDPEKGDKAEWKKKVTALIAATKALDKGTPGALDQFKEAVNCKACHQAHKPDKEH